MNPILIDLPMPILTHRLALRPAMPGDGKAINEAVVETFDFLAPYIPWATHLPTVEESEETVRKAYSEWILRNDLRINLFDRNTGGFVGGTGLHRINWKVPSFEIGVWVRKSREGQGLISEAVSGLCQYVFKELGGKRVEYRCVPDNVRSIAVAERLGFKLEARFHQAAKLNGKVQDLLVYVRFDSQNLPDVGASWSK